MCVCVCVVFVKGKTQDKYFTPGTIATTSPASFLLTDFFLFALLVLLPIEVQSTDETKDIKGMCDYGNVTFTEAFLLCPLSPFCWYVFGSQQVPPGGCSTSCPGLKLNWSQSHTVHFSLFLWPLCYWAHIVHFPVCMCVFV